MLTHLLFAPILLVVLLVVVIRVLTAPFRHRRWHRRRGGYGQGWGNGYNGYGGYGSYGYGFGRRPGRGLLTILALVALDRLFGRRW